MLGDMSDLHQLPRVLNVDYVTYWGLIQYEDAVLPLTSIGILIVEITHI